MSAPVATLASPDVGSAPGWPLVLYFHHVTPEWEHYTALSPDQFARALETVLDCYGDPIEPAQIGSARAGDGDRPRFLLTFDDGYRDNLVHAVPILRRAGVRAAFFVVTDAIERATHLAAGERSDDVSAYLTWDELATMRAEGHVVANHTTSHVRLPDCPADEQLAQVRLADRALRDRTGDSPGLVAYPYGEPPTASALLPHELGFATVRVPPRPWREAADAAPHAIRRTYLPTHAPESWRALCAGWRSQWCG